MDAVAASRQQLGQQMLELMKRELANIVTERQQIEGSAGPLNCAHGSAAGRSPTNAKTWRKESIEEICMLTGLRALPMPTSSARSQVRIGIGIAIRLDPAAP